MSFIKQQLKRFWRMVLLSLFENYEELEREKKERP